jgi:hypothetical protein
MSLARALTRILAWTAGIYVTLWILATLLLPITRADQPLDSLNGKKSIYATPVRELIYSLPAHCNTAPRKRLIILGSSAAKAYRPAVLRAATDADEVDNLALDFSNITQIRELFADLRRCFGEEALRSTTFLFVTTYILFAENSRWTTDYTVYESEKIRHGLYSGGPNALTPAFRPSLMPWAIDALRPVFALYDLKYKGRLLAGRLARAQWTHPSSAELQAKYRQTLGKMMAGTTDGARFGEEQFRELDRLVSDIRASGAGLVFVEQPVESWARHHGREFADYRTRMASFSAQHSIPVIDLAASAGDGEFSDDLHAIYSYHVLWTDRLAQQLREIPPNALGALSLKPKPSG